VSGPWKTSIFIALVHLLPADAAKDGNRFQGNTTDVQRLQNLSLNPSTPFAETFPKEGVAQKAEGKRCNLIRRGKDVF